MDKDQLQQFQENHFIQFPNCESLWRENAELKEALHNAALEIIDLKSKGVGKNAV